MLRLLFLCCLALALALLVSTCTSEPVREFCNNENRAVVHWPPSTADLTVGHILLIRNCTIDTLYLFNDWKPIADSAGTNDIPIGTYPLQLLVDSNSLIGRVTSSPLDAPGPAEDGGPPPATGRPTWKSANITFHNIRIGQIDFMGVDYMIFSNVRFIVSKCTFRTEYIPAEHFNSNEYRRVNLTAIYFGRIPILYDVLEYQSSSKGMQACSTKQCIIDHHEAKHYPLRVSMLDQRAKTMLERGSVMEIVDNDINVTAHRAHAIHLDVQFGGDNYHAGNQHHVIVDRNVVEVAFVTRAVVVHINSPGGEAALYSCSYNKVLARLAGPWVGKQGNPTWAASPPSAGVVMFYHDASNIGRIRLDGNNVTLTLMSIHFAVAPFSGVMLTPAMSDLTRHALTNVELITMNSNYVTFVPAHGRQAPDDLSIEYAKDWYADYFPKSCEGIFLGEPSIYTASKTKGSEQWRDIKALEISSNFVNIDFSQVTRPKDIGVGNGDYDFLSLPGESIKILKPVDAYGIVIQKFGCQWNWGTIKISHNVVNLTQIGDDMNLREHAQSFGIEVRFYRLENMTLLLMQNNTLDIDACRGGAFFCGGNTIGIHFVDPNPTHMGYKCSNHDSKTYHDLSITKSDRLIVRDNNITVTGFSEAIGITPSLSPHKAHVFNLKLILFTNNTITVSTHRPTDKPMFATGGGWAMAYCMAIGLRGNFHKFNLSITHNKMRIRCGKSTFQGGVDFTSDEWGYVDVGDIYVGHNVIDLSG